MAKISFFLHKGNEILEKLEDDPNYFNDINNKLPIYLNYTLAGRRLRLSTGLFINPNNWDSKKQRVKTKEPQYSQINDELTLYRERLHNAVLASKLGNKPLTLEYLKKELTGLNIFGATVALGYDTESYFWRAYSEFTEKSTNKGAETLKNYQNTAEHIRKFVKDYDLDLRFSSIDKSFTDKLHRYFFKDLKITRNTAGKHLKNLKAFLNFCYERKYTENAFFKEIEVFKDLQTIIYLELEEIKALKDLELNDKTYSEVRDFFLFGCFTGLRYSDISKITKSLVQGDFLVFTSQKTKLPQRTYLSRYAIEILEKYDYSMPSIAIQTVNEYIKKIAAAAGLTRPITKVRYIGVERVEDEKPLHEFISTHIAKKTFITLFFREGGRIDSIQQTTGNRDRDTLKHYLEFTDRGLKQDFDNIWNKIDL